MPLLHIGLPRNPLSHFTLGFVGSPQSSVSGKRHCGTQDKTNDSLKSLSFVFHINRLFVSPKGSSVLTLQTTIRYHQPTRASRQWEWSVRESHHVFYKASGQSIFSPRLGAFILG